MDTCVNNECTDFMITNPNNCEAFVLASECAKFIKRPEPIDFAKANKVHTSGVERDPHGKDANETGAKLDAGKNRLGLVIRGFARALWAVGEVGTIGAKKYTDNGWMEVPDGIARYDDAEFRHVLKEAMGEKYDNDTELLHAAHRAWNSLAILELMLREKEKGNDK